MTLDGHQWLSAYVSSDIRNHRNTVATMREVQKAVMLRKHSWKALVHCKRQAVMTLLFVTHRDTARSLPLQFSVPGSPMAISCS